MIHDHSAAPLLTSDDRIDEICDAYEAVWRSGQRPQIASFLDRSSEAERPALFCELLLMEVEYRQKLGEQPSRDEYLKLFPGFADQIEAIGFKHGLDAGLNSGAEIANTHSTFSAAPGARIGQFELLELLGAGASGEVWKARDSRLQRMVAIKIPRSRNLSEAELHRFLREGRAAAQLHHPNIVPVHDVDRHGDAAFIVSEYIAGENLRNRLARGRFSFKAAAELCAKLAEALHHAHEQGIVHRDLKPANVLVDDDDEPHITDFGLAKWTNDVRDLTLQGQLLGTIAYMAPEQARGEVGKVDRRTDVYALGVLLYEMLTRRCPFQGDEATVLHAIVNDEPAAPRLIDCCIARDLETICLKAMEKDLPRRYPSAQEMAVDLRRYLRDDPILARRASRLEKSWRWIRRRPAVAAAILLPLIVIAAASDIIKSINDESYRQQGYQRVHITTRPPGARVALAPLDKRTGEPNTYSGAVIRPSGKTPLMVYLKPDDYFVEAVIFEDDGTPDIAEAYQTVSPPELLNKARVKRNNYDGHEELAQDADLELEIKPAADVTADMIVVQIDQELRRKNPLLPDLLYVDARKTMPVTLDRPFISFETAKTVAQQRFKRLPSAAEYDAIVKAATDGRLNDVASGGHANIEDLSDGLAEWTTSKNDLPLSLQKGEAAANLRAMHILKGYGDPDKLLGLLRFVNGDLLAPPDCNSPSIGFRGVRTGTPRFVTP